MIETRESYQPLLKSNTPPSPSRRKQQRSSSSSAVTSPSYGTLAGESLLHADHDSFADADAPKKQLNGAGGYQNRGRASSTPQSAEPPNGQFEYTRPLNNAPIPVQQAQSLNNGTSRLPPAIPMRRRVDSSGDRSIGELSTVSGASGANRVQRSSSDGYDFVNAGNANGYPQIPPKHRSRRSRSPNPRASRGSPNVNNASYQQPGHPFHQHRRRPSDSEYSNSSRGSHHRRTSSSELGQLKRGTSSSSLYSLNSQGSMNSESLKMLPDPRWGGGSGGSRARSFSGGSRDMMTANSSSHNGLNSSSHTPNGVNISYSTDSHSFEGKNYGYGSVTSGKEVIMNRNIEAPRRGHRHTNSEISAASYISMASVDRSVDPVVTNMSKSSMMKGVTNEGVVKLQLPKDNFRLLSDRDLESGRVYKRDLVDNEDDYYLDYHITHDDAMESTPIITTSNCQCTCSTCNNCHGRRKQLPPSYYVMAVDSDIYRRMFDEVAESINMPCKLFYCGHHEDVDYPSIGIAVTGVVIIFAVMLWAMFIVDG